MSFFRRFFGLGAFLPGFPLRSVGDAPDWLSSFPVNYGRMCERPDEGRITTGDDNTHFMACRIKTGLRPELLSHVRFDIDTDRFVLYRDSERLSVRMGQTRNAHKALLGIMDIAARDPRGRSGRYRRLADSYHNFVKQSERIAGRSDVILVRQGANSVSPVQVIGESGPFQLWRPLFSSMDEGEDRIHVVDTRNEVLDVQLRLADNEWTGFYNPVGGRPLQTAGRTSAIEALRETGGFYASLSGHERINLLPLVERVLNGVENRTDIINRFGAETIYNPFYNQG